jgi:hypothetical protein
MVDIVWPDWTAFVATCREDHHMQLKLLAAIATGALTSIFWVSPAPTAVLTLDEQGPGLTDVIFFPDTPVGATSKTTVQAAAFLFPGEKPGEFLIPVIAPPFTVTPILTTTSCVPPVLACTVQIAFAPSVAGSFAFETPFAYTPSAGNFAFATLEVSGSWRVFLRSTALTREE